MSDRSKTAPPQLADIASLAVCTVIWSTTWRAIKLQLGSTPPLDSVVYRFALAAALLFGWCVMTGRSLRLGRRQHLEVLGQGLFGFTIQYGCVYVAEQQVASGAMAVIFAASPFANLLLFRILLNQRPTPLAWLATLLGVTGVAALSLSQIGASAGAAAAGTGVLIALAGVAAVVFGNYFAARAQAAGAALGPSTAWAMAYGAALLALFQLVTGAPWRFEASPRYVGALFYLSALGSVVAFLAYYALARRRGYGIASYIAALTPPAAMVISALTEGTRWGPGALVGVALVLLGQALLMRQRRA